MSKSTQLPLLTVITPVYNRADYLDETISSVLTQDYPNVEYIVLDDGSKDNSLEVIKQYQDKLIWDSHTNMGETLTVNKGFAMAKGQIIGVVNSDDPLLPGALQKIAEFMTQNPNVLVVYPDWDMIDLDGKVIQHIETFDYSYENMLRWHHCMPGPGAFFRKEVVDKLNGRDPLFRYVGDFDFWLRAGLLGPFARIPETLATFRVHPGSASVSQKGDMMAREHITLVNKIYNLPDLPVQVKQLKNEAYSSAYYIGGVVAGEQLVQLKREYFLKALRYSPAKYFSEYRERLPVMIAPFTGSMQLPLRKLKRSLSIPLRAIKRVRRALK